MQSSTEHELSKQLVNPLFFWLSVNAVAVLMGVHQLSFVMSATERVRIGKATSLGRAPCGSNITSWQQASTHDLMPKAFGYNLQVLYCAIPLAVIG